MTATAIAPGPKPSLLEAFIYGPGRDPLAFFTNLARTYGDVVAYRLGGEQLFFINHPQHIRDVLVTHQRNFTKGRGLERAKRLLGEGLLTSEGAAHLRQRRLMQPAFHRDRIAAYAGTMVEHADRLQPRWRDGATIDVAQEMNRAHAVDRRQDAVRRRRRVAGGRSRRGADRRDRLVLVTMLPFADLIERLPLPELRRARAARARLDAMIYGMIAERRAAAGGDRGDLLSMLLPAQDDEGDGGGMTDRRCATRR